MTKFQWILIGVFCAITVLAVIIFAFYKGGSKSAVTVTIWGTIPASTFQNIIDKTSLHNSKVYTIQYVEKTEDNFDADFIDALASGVGPDIFMLESGNILKYRNKIYPIPYNVYTARQFKDSFIEGSEIYMAPEGTLALPISVDPLVMYWNRSIFTSANITEPPQHWDEFINLVPVMTVKDNSLNISQSAVALGEFDNIANAKEIIANLAMQSGTPITEWNGNVVQSVFNGAFGQPTIPAYAAVDFYTEFANPAKPSYSWNPSLANSTDYFLSGNLGLYFGFADEISSLQLKNPNLDFDVTEVPSSRSGGVNVSFAKFNALAITKESKNPAAAFAVISILTAADAATSFSNILNLPPARRDLLSQKPADAYMSVFYDSAIRSKSWLDPSPTDTTAIFKEMVDSITSGRDRTEQAVSRVNDEISALLPKQSSQ